MARPRTSLKSKSKSARPARVKPAAQARKASVHTGTAKSGKAKSMVKSKPPSASKSGRWVYAFGGGKAAGKADMRNLLGGKGAGLAEMANLGLPVPPGFTITTEVCTHYYANGNS